MRGLWTIALLTALFMSPSMAQETRIHGENSIFASAGVKLGWAVKRGASEVDTLVIVRVIVADENLRVVRLDGVDPFTKGHKVFVAARPVDRQIDLSVSRAAFSDHPSTEFHFFASPADAAANKPKLTVFYLGVPDTTPEFADQRAAEAYLDKMLGK